MKEKYKALLIDDEQLSFPVIEAYLLPYPNISIVGKLTKSKPAAEKIISLQPDLLFLDIQMPVLNGFALLDAIAGHVNPYIIFTTAHEQYALQAFEFNAIGYLLKPIDREKFDKAIQRFLLFKENKNENDLLSGLEKLLSSRVSRTDFLEKVMIRDARKIFFIPVTDILYFESAGDYVKVYTAEKNYLINGSLQALEQQLSPLQFMRIHRSHIVNIEAVKEFLPHFNGEYKVVLHTSTVLKMSRHYKEPVAKLFKGL